MNDMSRPESAARLSEDIGDVLSSIRRMIAEDEAATTTNRAPFSSARFQTARINLPEGGLSDGDYLARRHGGDAALARHLASDSFSSEKPRHRRAGSSWQQSLRRADQVPDAGLETVASAHMSSTATDPCETAPATRQSCRPATAPAFVPLTASRGVPPRHAPLTAASMDVPSVAPILRLWPADRVIPHAEADSDTGHSLAATLPEAPQSLQWRPNRPFAQSDAAAETDQIAAPVEVGSTPPIYEFSGALGDRLTCAKSAAADQPEAFSPTTTAKQITPSDPVFCPDARAFVDDEDDFAEQFDAKALMRPTIEALQTNAKPADASVVPAPSEPQADLSPPRRIEPRPSFAERLSQVIRGAGHDGDPRLAAAPDVTTVVPAAAAVLNVAEVDIFGQMAAASTASVSATEPIDTSPRPVDASPIAAVHCDAAEASASDETMRSLIREMIAEELHGELGNRFARNLRAVIRREVASAIDDQMDRF